MNEAEYHAASQLTEWGIAALYCDQNGFDDAEIAVRQAFYGTPFRIRQLTMPCQQGVGCDDRRDLGKPFRSHTFRFHRQSSSLLIGELKATTNVLPAVNQSRSSCVS